MLSQLEHVGHGGVQALLLVPHAPLLAPAPPHQAGSTPHDDNNNNNNRHAPAAAVRLRAWLCVLAGVCVLLEVVLPLSELQRLLPQLCLSLRRLGLAGPAAAPPTDNHQASSAADTAAQPGRDLLPLASLRVLLADGGTHVSWSVISATLLSFTASFFSRRSGSPPPLLQSTLTHHTAPEHDHQTRLSTTPLLLVLLRCLW